MRVLAADVGGTHARFALFDGWGRRPRMLRKESWPSADYDGLLPVLCEFLDDGSDAPDAACLALAGPVEDGVCRVPNLGWRVDQAELSRETGIEPLRLLNDLSAIGHGVLVLGDHEVAALNGPSEREGQGHGAAADAPGVVGGTGDGGLLAVLGAGTGLGVAAVDLGADPPRVLDSEGGHADFAPRSDAQWALARFLARRHGRASWERVLSGGGLVDIYDHLGGDVAAAEAGARRTRDDGPAAFIAGCGLAGDDALCARALDMFVAAFGAFAANVAVTLGARSGVYVAGGIAPRILGALRQGSFMKSFRSMGRMRGYVEEIPVRVVLNEDVGLLGAASVAVGHGGPE
ncbi:MAG TPA: glucokinase [Longimicrobiales bacterium]|nr:glucokinase [Longimicrobiales bacterium]